jgi:hypothetical protein
MKTQGSGRRFLKKLSLTIVGLAFAMGVSVFFRAPGVPLELEIVQPLQPKELESLVDKTKAYSREDVFQLLLPAAFDDRYVGPATTIGLFYSTGFDGAYREDYCKAVQWYDRAARRQHIYPSMMLAIHYMMGQGVRRDPERAYLWYTQSRRLISVYPQFPELNYVDALDTVEMMLMEYEPVLRDPIKRKAWDSRVQATPLLDIPPVMPQPIPDIPLFGEWIGKLFYDSSGCHGELARGFEWLQSIETQFYLKNWKPMTGTYAPPVPPKAPTSSLVPEQ